MLFMCKEYRSFLSVDHVTTYASIFVVINAKVKSIYFFILIYFSFHFAIYFYWSIAVKTNLYILYRLTMNCYYRLSQMPNWTH